MLKRWYLTLHGWIAVIFALPILGVVLTGLLLSFDPIIQQSGIKPGALTSEKVLGWLEEHDPDNKARALIHRPYDHSFSIEGVGEEGEVEIDLRTGQEFTDDVTGFFWSDWMGWARRTHEHLTVANVELTVISTWIMLVVIVIGILMGLPKIRNTVAGWHKAAAWFLLPLLIASPLTGLFITYGITLNSAAQAPAPPTITQAQGTPPARSAPLTMSEAVQIIGARHDLSTMTWLRTRGGRLLVRLWEGGEARAYMVTREGVQPTSRNFSRLFHEGTFAGIWGGVMNAIISVALVLLSITGLWLFVTKQLRKYRNRRLRAGWNKPQPAE